MTGRDAPETQALPRQVNARRPRFHAGQDGLRAEIRGAAHQPGSPAEREAALAAARVIGGGEGAARRPRHLSRAGHRRECARPRQCSSSATRPGSARLRTREVAAQARRVIRHRRQENPNNTPYPNATSSTIISAKPIIKLKVTRSALPPRCASGISSSATTNIIAPAANASA